MRWPTGWRTSAPPPRRPGEVGAGRALPLRERCPSLLRAVAAVAAVGLVPVDDVPPRRDVVRPAVLVLQVVGVLPHVDAEDGLEPPHERAVLVRHPDDVEAVAVEDEPGPAAAELPLRRRLELLLEGVEGAEGLVDGLRQLARGPAATVGAHGRPEDGVVVVAAAVVADGRALVLGHAVEVG